MTDQTTSWQVRMTLAEGRYETTAEVEVDTGTRRVRGTGIAHRNPADFGVPAIGDELAAGRALVDAGRHLIGVALFDIGAVAGPEVDLA
jgi:hypothetical protein